ncbi:MAG: cupin domain-containing protein [Candidatus Acidiferrum sp.]|jgi:mannose-6-phosphate isomerase-like protein (cupin superfamily)
MPLTRRELCSAIPVALLPALLRAEDPAQQQGSVLSAMYPFDKLPVQTSNNAQFRNVLKGKLPTGESLEVHETTLPPGGGPHPPHHHVHSEMWLIRDGTVEITVNGTSYRLGPGSVGFVRSNDEHGITNVGSTPATYFVVAIGPGADS